MRGKNVHPRSYAAPEKKSFGDRKEDALDSHADFQRRELFSIHSSLRHSAATSSATACHTGAACGGSFSSGYLLLVERLRATARPGFWWELFSSFLRSFLSPLSSVITLAAVEGLGRIRRCRFPRVLVSRKSFSGMCVQRIFSRSVVLSSTDRSGLALVVEIVHQEVYSSLMPL